MTLLSTGGAIAILFSLFILSTAQSDVTFPNKTISKLAFGSCHKRKYVNTSAATTIWNAIQQEEADAFVWTGDSVYPPTRGVASLDLLQQEYTQMKHNASLGYAPFHSTLEVYGTWDDHDFGGNDLGVEMPNKPERAAAFLDFVGATRNATRDGIYSSVEWGTPPHKVKLILLDTRWHREPHCIPSVAHSVPLGAAISCITRWLTAGLLLSNHVKRCQHAGTILGEKQWKWLESQLHESNAQVHVIVSSIQVLTTNPVMESWGHYPQERHRLLKLLNGASGSVLLSGDVHHAEILDPNIVSNKQSLLEVTSSGMTHTCATPLYGYYLCRPLLETFDAHRHESQDNFFIGKNYGTVEIDWEKQSFEVLVHDDGGTVVLRTGSMPFQRDLLTEQEMEGIPGVNDGHLIPKFQKLLLVVNALIVLLIAWLFQKRRQRSKRELLN
jgi:alkaline phosphatase D